MATLTSTAIARGRRSTQHSARLRAALALALAASAWDAAAACPALLDRHFPRLQDERPQHLCQHAGKVLLVVNTASYCGFTPQYKSLEALHAKYAGRGLVVLGFPSNDFGAQEPGAAGEIAALCENTFGVRFRMFAKSRVAADAGALRNPLFAELARRSGESPRWNFHKYLVARDGRSVSSFSSETDPLDAKLVQSVEKLLDAK